MQQQGEGSNRWKLRSPLHPPWERTALRTEAEAQIWEPALSSSSLQVCWGAARQAVGGGEGGGRRRKGRSCAGVLKTPPANCGTFEPSPRASRGSTAEGTCQDVFGNRKGKGGARNYGCRGSSFWWAREEKVYAFPNGFCLPHKSRDSCSAVEKLFII